jgi:hypothetical protein
VSYCAEEGVRVLGEGKFLVSDSFPGNDRTKYCLTSKVNDSYFLYSHVTKLVLIFITRKFCVCRFHSELF